MISAETIGIDRVAADSESFRFAGDGVSAVIRVLV